MSGNAKGRRGSVGRRAAVAAGLVVALTVSACGDTPTEQVGSTALVSVIPADGAEGVASSAPIEVAFDRPIATGVHPIALQVGACPGPVVMGTWIRSADGLTLTFTPSQPLEPMTRYTIHVGGQLTDMDRAIVDLERNGLSLGGMWVTRMMVMGMTMSMGALHSGPEWLYPNGMYGLAFDFTTGP
jgi:hypothetical protein